MTDFLHKIYQEKDKRPIRSAKTSRKLMEDIRPPLRGGTEYSSAAPAENKGQSPVLLRVKKHFESNRQAETPSYFRKLSRGKTASVKILSPEGQKFFEHNENAGGKERQISFLWRRGTSQFALFLNWIRSAKKKRAGIGISLGILLMAFMVATFSFAHTTITLQPISAEIGIPKTRITADTKVSELNTGAKKIPGLKLTVEKTRREAFPASGKKYVEDRARGSLLIFNRYGSSPQPLIVGTRFVEPGGKVYRLVRPVVVPGAKVEEGKIVSNSIRADVVADQPGGEYNISASDFTIPGFMGSPKYDGFYAKSDTPISGGFKGEARIVSAQDITIGEEKVSRALFEELKTELQEKIPSSDDFILLDGSRLVAVTGMSSPKPNERKGEFVIEAKGDATVIIFKHSDIRQLLEAVFLAPDRPSTILPELNEINFTRPEIDAKEGTLRFDIDGSVVAARAILASEIRGLARAKRTSALETMLRIRPEIGGFSIRHFPPWRFSAPSNEERITIETELPK